MGLTNATCPAENTATTDQADFWDGRWDAHEIGWVIAGATALATTIISLYSILQHARNYYNPKQQRQVLRIMGMPAVYAIVSFFSYRYFRSYTYYSVAVVAYESLVLAAFLMLLLQYIGESTDAQKEVLRGKEKKKIPFPFWCVRYRPSKPYFLYALKWSVLQYSFLRPAISIAEIICQAFGVLCPTQYSIYFAEVYLDAIDFVSISVALYGLIAFYDLVKEQLAGKKPLSKFICIKLVVMLTFYQSFVFSTLESYDVIKATEYWTATNVADGLNALCICCEMVIMSVAFAWAFNWNEYKRQAPPGAPHTNPFWAVLDSLNYWDFLKEGWLGIAFLIDYIRGVEGTHAGKKQRLAASTASLTDRRNTEYGLDMDAAFAGVEKPSPRQGFQGDEGEWHGRDESRVPLSSPKGRNEAVFGSGRGGGGGGRPSESDDPYAASASPYGGAAAGGIEYSAAQAPVYGGVRTETPTSAQYPPGAARPYVAGEGAYEMQEQQQGGGTEGRRY